MGYFSLNGGTFGSLYDPEVQFGGQDVYGVQGGGSTGGVLVFGSFTNYTLSWAVMSFAEFSELYNRIQGCAGARVAMTLPITSGYSWSSVYGNVRISSFQHAGSHVTGVSVEIIRVSASL
jgi:hypothetical protein